MFNEMIIHYVMQSLSTALTTSGAAKTLFSPRVKIVVAGFKNNSKERHIFSEFKHGYCDKMKKAKT